MARSFVRRPIPGAAAAVLWDRFLSARGGEGCPAATGRPDIAKGEDVS